MVLFEQILRKVVLENALNQIEERQYATERRTAGVEEILQLAVVFQGKGLWVKQG